MILKLKLPIQTLAMLLCVTTASAQENRGTPEQRAACTPDAFRFCVSYIPDPTRVEVCLRRNMSSLSDACRSVFEPGGRLLVSNANREPRPTGRPAISAESRVSQH
jgi:hypothetical protein